MALDGPPTAHSTNRLARELEDGPLRRALGYAPAPPAPPAPAAAFEARLGFHGSASEYFRIWVVNLTLTLLSLGLYSAWAKVRKARWFAQHTSLLGDRFDYHGDPWRILLGRAIAVGLLILWTFAFDISIAVGLAMLALFAVVGPPLFAGAQRFRLANSSWRGLRFGFDVPRRRAYLVCVPLLAILTLGTVLDAVGVSFGWVAAASLAAMAMLPFGHARLKQMQRDHAQFGTQRFRFDPAGPEFFYLYMAATALAIVGVALTVLVGYAALPGRPGRGETSSAMFSLTILALALFAAWLFAWPYFAARMQQLVWSRTHLGGLRFRGEMKGLDLWHLVLGQTALVLLTAGLYWPFAAVAIARYRVQAIVVESDQPFGDWISEAPPVGATRASGDAAADLFGLDIGL